MTVIGFMLLSLPMPVFSAEFRCEVMSLEGLAEVVDGKGSRRALKEGDLLSISDTLETGENGRVDLAFDKEWKNVTRIEKKSNLKISSIYPTRLNMKQGEIFFKLKALPKNSSFEVQTPNAVAAARGTEFHALSRDNQTQVLNFSDSQVLVFGVDENGKVADTPTVLKNRQKTEVQKAGEEPTLPKALSVSEENAGQLLQSSIETRIKTLESQGRVGQLPTIDAIQEQLKKPYQRPEGEEPQAIDSRRRSFK